MRVISTLIHACLDYGLGLLLVALPWLVGFADSNRTAANVSVLIGLAILTYSFITRYEFSLVPTLAMPIHLWLDGIVGCLLVASPWLFGFAYQVWIPFVATGSLFVGIALLSSPISQPKRTAAKRESQVHKAGQMKAAPPDDGHWGGFTQPHEVLQTPAAGEEDDPNPPLASDPAH